LIDGAALRLHGDTVLVAPRTAAPLRRTELETMHA
jgi:hypothetical protein